jgi:hypothetical protein
MWVAQVSLPAWQIFRAKAGVAARIAVQKAAAMEKTRMRLFPSFADRQRRRSETSDA